MNISIIIGIIYMISILSAFSLVFIERKEPNTTWAWLIILLVLPGIGFIIYLFLGQNLSRQKIFREKKVVDEKKSKELLEKFREERSNRGFSEEFMDLIKMNYNNTGAIYTPRNKVDTFIDGEDKFKSLLEDIKNANSFIHIEYYIFRMDNLGKTIVDELGKKVKEGVEVRLLVDGMGSKSLSKKESNLIYFFHVNHI